MTTSGTTITTTTTSMAAYKTWLPQQVLELVVGRRVKFLTKGGKTLEGTVESYEKSWLKVRLDTDNTASTR